MKIKVLSAILVSIVCLTVHHSYAQGVRYQDSVFANYTKTTVTYSTVYNQQMDIYQPTGDVLTSRPVLVLAHGGSFTSGDRTNDNTITQLCADFAHKGYVTISIDYRLTTPQNLLNGDSAIVEVLRAVSDGKAAVRYLYEYSDSLKIDTNNLFIGGNSAGAVLFMQYGYIDSISQLSPLFQSLLGQIGGTLDGNSGNPGYSSNFKGIINLAGALNVPSWISYCSKPVVSAQGTTDQVVPYNCGNPEYGLVPVTLCGLDSLQPYITTNTPYWSSMIFPGDGHVPWQSDNAKFYRIDTMITSFLFKALGQPMNAACPALPNGIKNIGYRTDISVYPNPASDMINIRSSQFITEIAIYDETGRQVAKENGINSISYQLNTSKFSPGMYTISIADAMSYVPTMRKIIIE